jgi:hypothetical protein
VKPSGSFELLRRSRTRTIGRGRERAILGVE